MPLRRGFAGKAIIVLRYLVGILLVRSSPELEGPLLLLPKAIPHHLQIRLGEAEELGEHRQVGVNLLRLDNRDMT